MLLNPLSQVETEIRITLAQRNKGDGRDTVPAPDPGGSYVPEEPWLMPLMKHTWTLPEMLGVQEPTTCHN